MSVKLQGCIQISKSSIFNLVPSVQKTHEMSDPEAFEESTGITGLGEKCRGEHVRIKEPTFHYGYHLQKKQKTYSTWDEHVMERLS